jgi:uncharacterized protein (DUF488 family)
VLDLEKQSLAIVLLCSESNPQECHRWHIAQALTARGREVSHILKSGTLIAHKGDR